MLGVVPKAEEFCAAVLEATETMDARRFLIGVQWHPERMVPEDERQKKLLRAFVEAAVGAGE